MFEDMTHCVIHKTFFKKVDNCPMCTNNKSNQEKGKSVNKTRFISIAPFNQTIAALTDQGEIYVYNFNHLNRKAWVKLPDPFVEGN